MLDFHVKLRGELEAFVEQFTKAHDITRQEMLRAALWSMKKALEAGEVLARTPLRVLASGEEFRLMTVDDEPQAFEEGFEGQATSPALGTSSPSERKAA